MKYGITTEDYDRMYVTQGGVCAICGGLPTIKRLCVDHCHKTGTIRGLLCGSCNAGIGLLKDSLGVVTRAAAYLANYQNN